MSKLAYLAVIGIAGCTYSEAKIESVSCQQDKCNGVITCLASSYSQTDKVAICHKEAVRLASEICSHPVQVNLVRVDKAMNLPKEYTLTYHLKCNSQILEDIPTEAPNMVKFLK